METRDQGVASHIVVACLRYILSVRSDISKDDLIHIAGRISIEGRELVMTAAQQLIEKGKWEEKYKMTKLGEMLKEDGIREGFERGLEQGLEKAKIDIVRELLRDGLLTKEQISRVTKLTPEKIGEIENERLVR